MLPSLIFGVLVCALAWKRLWKRRLIIGLCAAVLFMYCWIPPSLAAARLWEMRYPATPPADTDIGAIVVLAGAVHGPTRPVEERYLGRETYVRCLYAAQLSRQWPTVPVVVTGGSLETWLPPYAVAMRDELVRRGVAPERIVVEGQSRSTYENAVNTAELLRQRNVRKVALVTSAGHMRRAEAAFRRQGVVVAPAACAFYSIFTIEPPDLVWPSPTAIAWNDSLIHEILGLAWYRIKGRI